MSEKLYRLYGADILSSFPFTYNFETPSGSKKDAALRFSVSAADPGYLPGGRRLPWRITAPEPLNCTVPLQGK